eukprot:COSAG05_NODE_118_length_17779_cov_4.419231_6_plen_760_part_00
MTNCDDPEIRVNVTKFSANYNDDADNKKLLSELKLEEKGDLEYFEVLRPDDIVKPMVDLDMKVDEKPSRKVKRQYKDEGIDFCIETFGCEEDDIAITDSSGFDGKEWKVSFHFVINGMSVRWGDLNPKRFDKMKDSEYSSKKGGWLDVGIYGKKLMRMVYCHKDKQPDRILKPLTHKDDIRKHVIQCVTEAELANRFVVPGAKEEEKVGKTATVKPYTLSEIELKILNLCDPDMPRDDWIHIGMALKGKGVSFDVWDEWSQDGDKYDESTIRKQWDSFSTKSSFSFGTVHYHAKENEPDQYHELVKSQYQKLFDHSEKALVQHMNKQCVYLSHMAKEGVYLLVRDDICLKTKAGMMEHFDDIDIRNKDDKRINPFTVWCKSAHRRKYQKLTFYPSFDYTGPDFNTFTGFAIQKEQAIEGNVQPILDHIKTIWCKSNEQYFEYTLNWMAHVIQKPYEKIKVALALKSTYEGAGKGCVVDKLMQIIGDNHSCQVANDTDLFGDFTATMSGKVLMDLDEAVWGGNKKAKGLLKNMITEKMVRIRMMRTDSYQEPSYHAFIFTSNEDWFLPANSNSRRYFALELDNRWAGVETTESKAYFDPVWAVKAEHLAHFLYHRDISKFDPRQVPITELLKEQAAFSLDSVEAWFRNCMEQGEFVDDEYENVYKWNAWIPKEVMHRLYKKEMGGGYGKLKEPNKFWPALKKLSGYDERRKGVPREVKFNVSLEESVTEWNAKRGDNVEVKKVNVIEKKKDEVNPSDLDL